MPPSSATQQRLLRDFAIATGDKKVAKEFLKNSHWNLNAAVDNFYSFGVDPEKEEARVKLNQMFDNYSRTDEPNLMSASGAMKYFEDIRVQPNQIGCLVVCELLDVLPVAEFTRNGFVEGWLQTGATTHEEQTKHIEQLVSLLVTDKDYFKKVYRKTFHISIAPPSRTLPVEDAIAHWSLLFSPQEGGRTWPPTKRPWLDLWYDFVQNRPERYITRDLWNQVEVFLDKATQDESLEWYDPTGAWPSAIDEFVTELGKDSGEL